MRTHLRLVTLLNLLLVYSRPCSSIPRIQTGPALPYQQLIRLYRTCNFIMLRSSLFLNDNTTLVFDLFSRCSTRHELVSHFLLLLLHMLRCQNYILLMLLHHLFFSWFLLDCFTFHLVVFPSNVRCTHVALNNRAIFNKSILLVRVCCCDIVEPSIYIFNLNRCPWNHLFGHRLLVGMQGLLDGHTTSKNLSILLALWRSLHSI